MYIWQDLIRKLFSRGARNMRKLLMIGMVMLLSAGVALAKDYEVKKKAGEFDVVVTIDKNPPVTGDNGVTVSVKDASGKVVKDAKVVVDYSMPGMPGMPPMNYKADAMQKGDFYAATMNLSMAGPWNIAVRISAGGKNGSMKFTIDAK
ncbi:MAG: copper resistance protein [Nitrospirae bacterium]|nr:copper resistance protein [Nitrospirota bacterium]